MIYSKDDRKACEEAMEKLLDCFIELDRIEEEYKQKDWYRPASGTKEHSAIRRASMNLTRALAILRRPY